MIRSLIVGAALAVLAGCTQSVQLSATSRSGFDVRASGELFKLDGAGPFPAVVVLHGCSGLSANQQAWAYRLNRWGYVAFVVDSFGPRGFQSVCNTPNVPPLERARDALAAATWLRGQPFVDPARVGVIGFSHGGSTVLTTILEPVVRDAEAAPFRAAIAYYPGCARDNARHVTDALILIGYADDWTLASRCSTYVGSLTDHSPVVELKVYPGAYHAFDALGPPRSYLGHMLGYHPVAASDSFDMTRRFLDARLK